MNNCTKKKKKASDSQASTNPEKQARERRGCFGVAAMPGEEAKDGAKIPVGPGAGAAGWDGGREEALGSCLPEPNRERLGLPSGGRYGAILGLAFPSVRALARGTVASKRDVSAAPWLCQVHPCRPSASRCFTKGVGLGAASAPPPPPSFPPAPGKEVPVPRLRVILFKVIE